MGVNFTQEQQRVIDTRNTDILVSAAAGSGKTAVLVERIIKKVSDLENPCDIDTLLVMTFTKAAAAEMKGRLSAALSQKISEASRTNDRRLSKHLSRQLSLLRGADICTIDSFCTNLIRNNFSVIGIDPSFRVAEEAELKLIKGDVIEKVLEQAYESIDVRKSSDNSEEDYEYPKELLFTAQEFEDFLNSFSAGKSDNDVVNAIEKIYEFSQSAPYPTLWLRDAVRAYDISDTKEMFSNKAVKSFFLRAAERIKGVCENYAVLEKVCNEPDGPYMYGETIEGERTFFDFLYEKIENGIDSDNYEEIRQLLLNVSYDVFSRKKDESVNLDKRNFVKLLRDKNKKTIAKITSKYFYTTDLMLLEMIKNAGNTARILSKLTGRFLLSYSEEKKRRGIVDFSDLEHFALDILYEEKEGVHIPSAIAESYRAHYSEIMVDEYQDSNQVQEEILQAIANKAEGKHNLFMVGDIKQSIYGFRQACPRLFNSKRESFPLYEGSDELRIDLHKNFRSRREVIDCVNDIFEQIMIKEVGGVEYDEDARLRCGAEFKAGENYKSELLAVIESDEIPSMQQEAIAVALRIKDMLESGYLVQGKDGELRSVKYSDFAVLLRSTKGWDKVFTEVFKNYGIPCVTEAKEGYFNCFEVNSLLNYLSVINNPRDDEALCEALKGPFGDFTDMQLARIRSKHTEGFFYESVFKCLSDDEADELSIKVKAFFEKIDYYVKLSEYTPVHQLIAEIIENTGFDMLVRSMENGEVRLLNLYMLLQKATDYGKTSFTGVHDFVRYMSRLKKYKVDYGLGQLNTDADDVVKIMTIHKSKGLEFPVCFVSGMGKSLNNKDSSDNIILDAQPGMGIGLNFTDKRRRVKGNTIIKNALISKKEEESAAEELRILYVALTRAREKLIMTGYISEKTLEAFRLSFENGLELTADSIISAKNYFSWVIPAVLKSECSDIIEIRDTQMTAVTLKEEICREHYYRRYNELIDKPLVYDEELAERFSWKYPYECRYVPTKFSVTAIKHAQNEEMGELHFEKNENDEPVPQFMLEDSEKSSMEKTIGSVRGTAYHRFFELIDYKKNLSKASLEKQLSDNVKSGHIEKIQADKINIFDIAAFGKTELAGRMKAAFLRGELFREQPFCMLRSAKEINEEYPDVEVVIQGIIDAVFKENGEYIIVDYKTDRGVTEEDLIKRYSIQLENYANAIEQVLEEGAVVKEKIIYSVSLKKAISIPS